MRKEGMIAHVTALHEYFNRSTRSLTEDDSAFAPQPGMFTVAQQVAHAAQTVEWFIQGAFSPTGFNVDFEGMDREVRACTSLTEARAWFERACAGALAAVNGHSDAEWAELMPAGPVMGGDPRFVVFGGLTDHTAHHRGALTIYTRLLGKVPPMPYMEM